jgi:hypothetical protein
MENASQQAVTDAHARPRLLLAHQLRHRASRMDARSILSIDQLSIALHKEASLMRRDHAFLAFTGLVCLCVGPSSAGADDGSRYAAIWDKSAGPALVARHGMSANGYQQEFNTLLGQGHRLKLVSGY